MRLGNRSFRHHSAAQGEDEEVALTDAPESEDSEINSGQGLQVDPTPRTCSYCGATDFSTVEDTGRGLRAICDACDGAMLRTDSGQWTPAGPGATNNHPSTQGDPSQGGVPGVANVGVDSNPYNDAAARHASFSVWEMQHEARERTEDGWHYDDNIVGQIKATDPEGNEHVRYTSGDGLRNHRHPDHPVPMYHGTDREIEGDQIEPGRPGNYVKRMKNTYMTDDPNEARNYARATGKVYEVKPTGWYGHRSDAKGSAWASPNPLNIVREVPHDEAPGYDHHGELKQLGVKKQFNYPQELPGVAGSHIYRGLHGPDAAAGAEATRRGEMGSGDWGHVIYTAKEPGLAMAYGQSHAGDETGVVMHGQIHPDAKVLDSDSIPETDAHHIADFARQHGHDVVSNGFAHHIINPDVVKWDPKNYSVDEAVSHLDKWGEHYGDGPKDLWGTHHEAKLGDTSTWHDISQRHWEAYGNEDPDDDYNEETGEGDDDPHGYGEAATHLAFDRHGEDFDAEGGQHSHHDLTFHHESVHPRHIDFAPTGDGLKDHRVKRAYEGYTKNPSKVPPLVLVHRHGVYQVADGHHRAEAAAKADVPVNAYVHYSEHSDEPFADGNKAPFYGAEPKGEHKQATIHIADIAWCANLHQGHCHYAGDKLSNGITLGIPQDRGICPWKDSAFQQSVCPISSPGPLAVMQVTGSTQHTSEDDDYRMDHQAPDADFGSPLHEVEETMPDYYKHPEYYSTGQDIDHESHSVIRGAQGDSEKKIRVYRSLPAEHAGKGFRTGDWVSTSKSYARQHGMQDDAKHDWPVIRTTVPAKHLRTEGDIHEWGYTGPAKSPMIQFKGGHHQEIRYKADGTIGPVKRKTGKLEPRTAELLALAAIDDDFRFHFTASWNEVRDKAKRLRREGQVRIAIASPDGIGGEVKGDHHVYETMITFIPGSRRTATWSCGCKWGAYAWGRSAAYARFEGRPCSHVLAMRFEAQAQGMFGKEVAPDRDVPKWLKPNTPVVVQYERPTDRKPKGKDMTRRAVPPANMKRTFSSLLAADEDPAEIVRTGMSLGMTHEAARQMLHEAQEGAGYFHGTRHELQPGQVLTGGHAQSNQGYGQPGHHVYYSAHPTMASAFAESAYGPEDDLDAKPRVYKVEPVQGHEADPDEEPEAQSYRATHVKVLHEVPYDEEGVNRLYSQGSIHEGSWEDDEQRCPHCHGYIGPAAFKAGKCPHCGHALAHQGSLNHHTDDARKHAPDFGVKTPQWGGFEMQWCPQCWDGENATGCGHCGGTGQVLVSTDGSTHDPVPDQNKDAGSDITGGFTDTGSLHEAKDESGPSVAGIALKAADTGRVLMLQRGMDDETDPAAGTWEFPGGHIEDGDQTSLHGGIREWEEEVGQGFPENGVVTHAWTSPNGVYQGHVVVIPSEKDVDFANGRATVNPDDPKGDSHEQSAWWDVDHAKKNPAIRPECKDTPWKDLKDATVGAGPKVAHLVHLATNPDPEPHEGFGAWRDRLWDGLKQNRTPVPQTGHLYRSMSDGEMDAAHAKGAFHPLIGDHLFVSDDPDRMGSYGGKGGGHIIQIDPNKVETQDTPSNYNKHLIEKTVSHVPMDAVTKQWSWDPEKKDHVLQSGVHHEAASWDPLYSLEESSPMARPDHSNSENPASSGFLTAQDPQAWSNSQLPTTLSPDSSIDSVAMLHEEPEAALPSTDGDREDYQEPNSEISPVDEELSPMGTTASAADIVAKFQATAAAQGIMSGSSDGKGSGMFSDGDIAANAKAKLGDMKKTALKDFSHSEQQDLINEGKGSRARNFSDLKLAGTHYEALQNAISAADCADDDIFIL